MKFTNENFRCKFNKRAGDCERLGAFENDLWVAIAAIVTRLALGSRITGIPNSERERLAALSYNVYTSVYRLVNYSILI